ncbi:LRP2-binding protein [Osmerus mordax]|uniref:LRP2-binding protein n=1 Tax=Osmerus mordax TaxID=8014 RepID=UPI00350F21A9
MKSASKTTCTHRQKSSQVHHAIKSLYPNEGGRPTALPDSPATQVEKAASLLRRRADEGDRQAFFLLGQLYFEEGLYEEAKRVFDSLKEHDPRAMFQMAVMSYDGLGAQSDQAEAVSYMRRVCQWEGPETGSIRQLALYNLGRAYLEGFGVPYSIREAERLWLQAAEEGSPGDGASATAQTNLAMLYCRPEHLDLQKAFFWHSEACGNGSLESQGALGVMFLYGRGVRQDPEAALDCLKEASERGNVYAQAHLVAYYYHRKLYTRAVTLAKRICSYDNIPAIATATECLPEYVDKGVAIALFYYARCLQLGRGVAKDTQQAQLYFIKVGWLTHVYIQTHSHTP